MQNKPVQGRYLGKKIYLYVRLLAFMHNKPILDEVITGV